MTCFSLLQRCLQVLNVSGNHLDSIRELGILREMTQFMASENNLTDLKDITVCLGSWHHLNLLDFSANPVSQKSKYRDKIVIMSPRLGKTFVFISLPPSFEKDYAICSIYVHWSDKSHK